MPATKQAYENNDLKIFTDRLEYLDKMVSRFLKEDLRQFFIIRAHRYGVPIYEYCGGVSTKEYGIRQDTISCVFSITKIATAAMIMKLQEDGLLDIGEPVSTYLDCFRNGKDNILIWHLLTHVSGISDEAFWEFEEKMIKDSGLEKPAMDAPKEVHDAFLKQLNCKLGLDENTTEKDYSKSRVWFIFPNETTE